MIYNQMILGETNQFPEIVYIIYNQIKNSLWINEIFRPIESIRLCANDIADLVSERYNDYNNIMANIDISDNATEEEMHEAFDWVFEDIQKLKYTGWQFVSLEDRKQNADKFYLPYVRDSKGVLPFHMIKFAFFVDDKNSAVSDFRNFKQHNYIEDESNNKNRFERYGNSGDDIVIRINISIIEQLERESGTDGDFGINFHSKLTSLISHELQHATEQYIFRDSNVLMNNRRKLYQTVRNFVSDLEPDSKEFVLRISHLLTPEEQRARITQVDSLLKYSIEKDGFIDYVISNYNKTYKSNYSGFISYTDRMIRVIVNSDYIESVVRLNNFIRTIKKLKSDKMKDVVQLLGDCLKQCGMISKEIRKDSEIIEAIENNCLSYINDVYDIVRPYAEKICKERDESALNENLVLKDMVLKFTRLKS